MKKTFIEPTIDFINFDKEDIITGSTFGTTSGYADDDNFWSDKYTEKDS